MFRLSDYKMGLKNVQIIKGNSKIIRIMPLKPKNATTIIITIIIIIVFIIIF